MVLLPWIRRERKNSQSPIKAAGGSVMDAVNSLYVRQSIKFKGGHFTFSKGAIRLVGGIERGQHRNLYENTTRTDCTDFARKCTLFHASFCVQVPKLCTQHPMSFARSVDFI
jgi:hypothetical protein